MNKFFVNRIAFGENGWSYNNVEAYDTLTEARKAYHGVLNKFIGYEKYTQLSVYIMDAMNNVLEHEEWVRETAEVTE